MLLEVIKLAKKFTLIILYLILKMRRKLVGGASSKLSQGVKLILIIYSL
jgi:hypothetical protein